MPTSSLRAPRRWLADRDRPTRRGLALLLLCLAFALAPAPRAFAAAIGVDTLADNATAGDGDCTLREAINNANSLGGDTTSGDCAAGSTAPTVDTITFSVAGAILTGSPLPAIHGSAGQDTGSVRIDGGGTITLQRSAGPGPGLEVGRFGALTSDVIIRGLTITAYNAAGIDLNHVSGVTIEDCVIHANGQQGIIIRNVNTGTPSGVTIQDNLIGLDGGGSPSANDDDGIQINDGADKVTIDNNTISANGDDGIDVRGGSGDGSGHLIQNNRIGTNTAGTSCGGPPNTFGNELIGINYAGGVHDTTIQNNIIGCNGRTQAPGGGQGDGIEISGGALSVNHVVQNNYIGTNAADADLGNHQNGIDLTDGNSDSTIRYNTIAYNAAAVTSVNNDGIHVADTGSDNNLITQNSIYDNGGTDATGLGIDLNGDGVEHPDSNDPDGGSNMLMNFPIVVSAAWVGGVVEVRGCFDGRTGVPSEANFTLEFFCNDSPDSSGFGEGRTYAASVVHTGDVGTVNYGSTPRTCSANAILHSFLPPAGCFYVTANATNTTNNSSEFGPNAEALSCVLSPQTATNVLPGDTAHSVTATVFLGGAPVTAAVVDFTVAGVNPLAGPDPVTDGLGIATFGYTSNGLPGLDTITASVTFAGQTATCLGPHVPAFPGPVIESSVTKLWELPTAVEVADFRARRAGRTVVLDWRTLSEFKHAGFRVVRADAAGRETVVTSRLIAPRGGELGGASYGFTDWVAPAGPLRYWLEDVDTLGHASRHGPIGVRAARGRPIILPPGPGPELVGPLFDRWFDMPLEEVR